MKAENLREQIKKLLSHKGMGAVIIGIFAGIILLLMPSSKESDITEANPAMTGSEYCALLEQKAEALIKELPEVDDCSVFITLESGYKYIYATDQHVREESNFKETEKTVVLAGNGNGEEPLIIQETMPKVAGVAIVCPKSSYETQYRIVELISALFDIKSNRISVKA
ncbi:MAG: hypothetical protein E7586_05900 [Ruminococcaceae bacterium]|nr:hypothetical protein [Oscillospiraceae bacterium]